MTTYVPGGDPTSVGGRRIVAYLIDWVLFVSIVPAIVFFATADLTNYTDGPTCTNLKRSGQIDDSYFCGRVESTDADGDTTYDTIVVKKASFVISNAVAGGYLLVVMWLAQGLTGMTLGKLVVGIRTVREDGRPPGLGKQILRGIGGIADAVPFCLMPLVPVVGLITMFVTKGHRRVGDLAARTYVVRSSAAGAPIVVPGVNGSGAPTYGAAGAAAATTPPPPSGYSPTPPAPGATWAMPAPPPPSGVTTTPPPPSGFTTPPPADQPGYAAPGSTVPETPAEPAAESQAPPEPPTQPSAQAQGPQPGVAGPQWDPQRNAYVQWDPDGQRWLTYDDTTGAWKPLT